MSPDQKPRRPRPGTQTAIVLDALEAAAGGWIGVDFLLIHARTAAAHSVISTLRIVYGCVIENRQWIDPQTGRKHSAYRLLPSEATKPGIPSQP